VGWGQDPGIYYTQQYTQTDITYTYTHAYISIVTNKVEHIEAMHVYIYERTYLLDTAHTCTRGMLNQILNTNTHLYTCMHIHVHMYYTNHIHANHTCIHIYKYIFIAHSTCAYYAHPCAHGTCTYYADPCTYLLHTAHAYIMHIHVHTAHVTCTYLLHTAHACTCSLLQQIYDSLQSGQT
jgi:hypothetical protein